MALTVTSLRVDSRETEGWFRDSDIPWSDKTSCPYLIVNATFKIGQDDTFLWDQAKADAEEYQKVLIIDDPKKYEKWITERWDFSEVGKYEGYGRAWTHNDQPWHYIEKFDTFHFREWIADCHLTRTILEDIAYFRDTGRLRDVYRTLDDQIVLNHFRVLHQYWD